MNFTRIQNLGLQQPDLCRLWQNQLPKFQRESKQKCQTLDWQSIRGFRNILVHNYLGDIDYTIIRAVIEIELPKLKQAVSEMLIELE